MPFSCYWNPTVLTVGGCQSYIVTIEAGGGFEDKKAEDVTTITVKRFGRKIFTGTLPEFMLLCMHD